MQLEGVYSVLPTPFQPNGDLDEPSLRRVIDLFVSAGVHGVTALGVTGEVARLDDVERRRVLEVVVDHVKGRIGVVAGTTAEGTGICIAHSRHAVATGATAVMVSPPRMAKLNSEAVVRHYKALADAVDIEIVCRLPADLRFAMEPWLLARIAREIPRARTIKLEDPPTPFNVPHHRGGRRDSRANLWRAGRRVPARGTARGRHRRHDRFRVSEILVKIVSLFRTGAVSEAADTFYRAVPDAVRVPGRNRHGDPQGSAPPPGRTREPATRPPRPRSIRRRVSARSRDEMGRAGSWPLDTLGH